jgi:hypothetical protein
MRPPDRLDTTRETEFFWGVAEPLLDDPATTIGTLMGFPCLRVEGAFFATCDHRSGDLVVKLPRHRVAELVDDGRGRPFAPAGRVFKEWVLVPERDAEEWRSLLDEARAFAAPPATTRSGQG